MNVHKLASSIFNDVMGGLQGYEATINMYLEQLEDEVVEERLLVIKQYSIKNLIPRKDLMYSLNCIQTDCRGLSKCCDLDLSFGSPTIHFQIPQIVNDFGESSIEFIGSVDKAIKFKVYTSENFKFRRYRMRGKNKPFVYIDTTPNENNYYDCFVFNTPLLERVSVVAIFKDPRQVQEWMAQFGCCTFSETDNFTWIDTEVKQNLIKKKLAYYRQYYPQPQQNDQVAR